MSKYYTVEIEVRIRPMHCNIPAQDIEVEISGYVDGDRTYDLVFQSGFWMENYFHADDFSELFLNEVHRRKDDF